MSYIVETYTIKAAIYQAILQNAEFLAWCASNVPSLTPQDLIAEIASDTPSEDVVMPAIRYRVVNHLPVQQPRAEVRTLIFDLLVESNENGTDQMDELLDLLRNIFLENEGRDWGIFTESANYKTAVGAVGLERSLLTWDAKEINRGEISNAEPTFLTNAGGLMNLPNYHYGYIRLQVTIADARAIV